MNTSTKRYKNELALAQKRSRRSKGRLGSIGFLIVAAFAVFGVGVSEANANMNILNIKGSVNHGPVSLKVPNRIPVSCVKQSAQRYQVPEMALLAILKQESGGRTGVVGNNSNGSKDYGPAQFNDRSWGKYMREKYGITLSDLNNNMCQAIMAQGYALRSEWNRCIKKGDRSIWCAVALYHSPTKKFQDRYVKGVWSHYERMIKTGEF